MAPKPLALLAGLALSLAIAASFAIPAGAAGSKPAGASKTEAASKAEAKKAHKKALQLMKQEKWAEALDQLEASHAARPDPALKHDIGTCLFHLGKWVQAAKALGEYLDEAGDDAGEKKRAEVESTLEEIEGHIGDVTVECDVYGASLTVDGVPSDEWEIRLDEGKHEILVEAEGHNPVTTEIDVKGGKAIRVKVDMITPDDEDGKGKKAKAAKKDGDGAEAHAERAKLPVHWFAATAGLAGALALTAVITGSVALSRQDHYAGMDTADDWRPYRDATLRLGLATDVLWGVAAGAAVAAVVLAVFTDFARPAEKKPGKEAALSVSPTLGTYGLVLTVEF